MLYQFLKNIERLVRDFSDEKTKYYVFRNEQQFNQFMIQLLKNITQVTLDSMDSKYQMSNYSRIRDLCLDIVSYIFKVLKNYNTMYEDLKTYMTFFFDEVLKNDKKAKYSKCAIEIIRHSFKKNDSDTWVLFFHFFIKLEDEAQYTFSDERISDKQKCIKEMFRKIIEGKKDYDLYEAMCSKSIRGKIITWLTVGSSSYTIRQIALNLGTIIFQFLACQMVNDTFSSKLVDEIPHNKIGNVHETIFYAVLKRLDDINMYVRKTAVVCLHTMIEANMKNLGKDDSNLECLLTDQYFDAFSKVVEKIDECTMNNSLSAIKCTASYLNNNKYLKYVADFFNIEDSALSMRKDQLERARENLKLKIKELCDEPDLYEHKIGLYNDKWSTYYERKQTAIANLSGSNNTAMHNNQNQNPNEDDSDDEDPFNMNNDVINLATMANLRRTVESMYQWNQYDLAKNEEAGKIYTLYRYTLQLIKMSDSMENLILPRDMAESNAMEELKGSFNAQTQKKYLGQMGYAIRLLNGKNLNLRTAVVELIRTGLRWKMNHYDDIAVHYMLPLVFDDTTNKSKNKKADDEPQPAVNANAEADEDDGFKINETKDKEDMPLKDVVVITIFQHWFEIEISGDNKCYENNTYMADLAKKLKYNIKNKIEKYLKDFTMRRYLIELFSSVLKKYPQFKKLMDKNIFISAFNTILSMSTNGVSYYEEHYDKYMDYLKELVKGHESNSLSTEEKICAKILNEITRKTDTNYNEILNFDIVTQISQSNYKLDTYDIKRILLYGARKEYIPQLIAEVVTIIILFESNKAAGLSVDISSQTINDYLYKTIDSLFKLSKLDNNIQITSITFELAQYVNIAKKERVQKIDWESDSEFMNWMKLLNSFANYMILFNEEYYERLAECEYDIEGETSIKYEHGYYENALYNLVKLCLNKISNNGIYMTSMINIFKAFYYYFHMYQTEQSLITCVNVLGFMSLRYLELIQDSIDNFEKCYHEAERKKGTTLTDEEKATGILEDRKNILDKNLRVNYLKDFLGNFNDGKERNKKIECYNILEIISLEGFDHFNPKLVYYFRQADEDLTEESMNYMSSCFQWIQKFSSFKLMWKMSRNLSYLMYLDEEYCKKHIQLIIWLLLAQSEIEMINKDIKKAEDKKKKDMNLNGSYNTRRRIKSKSKNQTINTTFESTRAEKNRMYSTIADPDDAEGPNVNKNSLRSYNEEDNELRGLNAQNESHSYVQEASHLDADHDPIAQFRRKQKQAYDIIKSFESHWKFLQLNLIYCIGDFYKRFPAIISPFTTYFMEILCCKDEKVRLAAVSMVSHLHSSKTIRDNGSITVLAFLHNESSQNVSQVVNSFFMELINTTGSEDVILNTIIPDVVTKFTDILYYINNQEYINTKEFKNLNLYNILRKNFRNNNGENTPGGLTNGNNQNNNNNRQRIPARENNNNNEQNQNKTKKSKKNDEEIEVMSQFKKMMQWLISLEEEQTNKSDNKKEIPQFYKKLTQKLCERFKSFTKNDESDKYIFKILALSLKELVKYPTDVVTITDFRDYWRDKASNDREVYECFKTISQHVWHKTGEEYNRSLELLTKELNQIYERCYKKEDELAARGDDPEENSLRNSRMSGVVYDETQAVKGRKSVISNLVEDDESDEGQKENNVSQTNSPINEANRIVRNSEQGEEEVDNAQGRRVGNKRVRRKRN